MENCNETIRKIREILEERGWSLYRLSKACDIPYSSLNNIFQRNTEPTLPLLRSICNGLGISLSEFFEDEPAPPRIEYTIDERNLVIEYRSMNRTSRQLLKTYAAGLNKKLPDMDNEELQ